MAGSVERRHTGATLPDLFDWIIPDFPGAVPTLRSGAHSIRIEESMKDGKFELNAELPGMDPDKDVEITVEGDMLTIRAERSETKQEGKGHSEFHYGALARAVKLPAGARPDEAEADYKDGILTVTVPVAKPGAEARTISVRRNT
ncbi:Hsp20/alpha crystallin family protein [Streptomyces sp. WMMB 322]|uniref:Hsp20/alpha crystallin family protein n=1 Tax=Streptomyces sp. WMMB 322 TaxID=1286821 RepID=UPI0006E1C1CC|nr:Hsp20/alpha crystallin family protein [Streptomyces sp. WMMB 322]SCK16110.1 Molecular chaperone IbpA, HSP20 family [Streptomyces sp. WMMB 322]